MNMTKDALELLQETARDAAEAESLDVGDARNRHFAVSGQITAIPVPPPIRNHKVATLEALGAYACNLDDLLLEDDSANLDHRPVIYHSPEQVVLVVDDGDRRDRVTLPLLLSERFTTLKKMELEKPSFPQRDIIQMLRLTFGAATDLIAAFRKIDLRATQAASMTSERGRESLGRSIESQILNAADIPETITLRAPIYTNLGENEMYDVRCAVEIDAVNARIQIAPEPDRLDEILHRHQADIAHRLESMLADYTNIPVYYGTP